MWTWLTNNGTALGVVLASIPIAYAVIQFVFAKRAEAKRVRFKTYHSLIKQLVERENPDVPKRLDRQIAVVYELRNFKHYYPVTLRILQGLKADWSSSSYGPPEKLIRLLTEVDLTIAYITPRV